MNATPRKIQPRRALRAIRNLIADPERTDQVFEVLDALSGDSTVSDSNDSVGPRSGSVCCASRTS